VALALAVFPTVALALAVFPMVAHAVFPRVPYVLRVAHAVLLQVLDLKVFPLKAFALTKSLPTSPIKKTLKSSLVVNLKVLTVTSDLSVVEDLDLTVASSDLVAVLTRIAVRSSVSLNATLVLEVDSEISEISRTEQDASVQTLTFQREVFAMVAIANSVAMVAVALAPTLRTLLANVLEMFKVPEVVVLMANVAVAPSELLVAIMVLEASASVSLSLLPVVVALAVTLFAHLPFPISVVVDSAPLDWSLRMLPTSLSLRMKSLSRMCLSRRRSLSRRSLSRRPLSRRRSLPMKHLPQSLRKRKRHQLSKRKRKPLKRSKKLLLSTSKLPRLQTK
jgi:hypothetical protein